MQYKSKICQDIVIITDKTLCLLKFFGYRRKTREVKDRIRSDWHFSWRLKYSGNDFFGMTMTAWKMNANSFWPTQHQQNKCSTD